MTPEELCVQVCTMYLLQGHFHLWSHEGQEDQWDLDSRLSHLFQAAQLVLGDPRIMLNTNSMVKIVYQVISNSEILCERFQTFLYDLSGVCSTVAR